MGKYLVTGGMGYIGSHIAKKLLENDNEVFVIDDLSIGHKKVARILNLNLYSKNIRNQDDYYYLGKIDCIIHLAGFSQILESILNPSKYYYNNISSTIHLLDCMVKHNIKNIIFSSSAAVYGELPFPAPILESDMQDYSLAPNNPYGKTKKIIEDILLDYHVAHGIEYVSLRYFNAAGADPSGIIGEDHRPETHLIPLVLKVALGQKDNIKIFGTDYPTDDGTCVRDYIHVSDLADAHILAAKYLFDGGRSTVYNLGSEQEISVLEVINVAKKITGCDIPAISSFRRKGDPSMLVASSSKIKKELLWKQKFDIESIIETAWRWHKSNPNGYEE